MNYLKLIQSFVKAHSNPILVGSGLAALLSGAVALIPVSYKAGKKVANIESERGEKLSKPELVNLVWKDYVVPTTTVLTGTGLIVFGTVKQEMKISDLTIALATANNISADKVKETLGLKTDYENIVKDNPKKELSTEGYRPHEIEWFFDALTNNLFEATENEVMARLNEFNSMLLRDGYAYVNTYCSYMGIRNVLLGGDLGWDGDLGPIEITIRGELVNDKAVKLIELSREPERLD